MDKPIDAYWRQRLTECKTALKKNNFEAYVTDTIDQAGVLITEELLPALQPQIVSWGDSESMLKTGIIETIAEMEGIELIRAFEAGVAREEIMERRRQALLADLFFTGSNAVTEAGQLVNLDMVGNRVGGITFGPRQVVIVVGRNKIVADLASAMQRIRDYAAPLNAIRHPGWKTPCVKTGRCHDCKSPDRICNVWTITEKSYPKGRIKVILVNEDLGL